MKVERDMLISLQGGEANALVEEEKTPIVGRIKILVNSPGLILGGTTHLVDGDARFVVIYTAEHEVHSAASVGPH